MGTLSVAFTPAEFEGRDVSGAVVVVIDCFRASTSIVAALAAGAHAVYPFLTVEEAVEFARGMEGAVLAGERGGARIKGFELGNSPDEFTRAGVGGKDVVMTTTNGTRLLAQAAKGRGVYIGAFVNATAVAAALEDLEGEIVLACAGTEGEFSIEDALCAGMIAARMAENEGASEDESAAFARLAYESVCTDFREAALSGRGAANVAALGLGKDLEFCLEVDSIPVVPRGYAEPLRVVVSR